MGADGLSKKQVAMSGIIRKQIRNTEDCEGCVNDTCFAAQNTIPDKRPDKLSIFLN